MKQPLIALLIGAGLGFLIGHYTAPREILDEEVTYDGPFKVETRRVLSATVESIRSESRFVPLSYTGTVTVEAKQEQWVVFEGHQTLSVPATVTYFIDLTQLKDSNVIFDDSTKQLTVLLPKLMLTVSFHPDRAIEVNEGSLTLSDSVVQELRKLNYSSARKAIVKQAQQAGFVETAKSRARESVASFFHIPLRIAGMEDVHVRVVFESDSD